MNLLVNFLICSFTIYYTNDAISNECGFNLFPLCLIISINSTTQWGSKQRCLPCSFELCTGMDHYHVIITITRDFKIFNLGSYQTLRTLTFISIYDKHDFTDTLKELKFVVGQFYCRHE